MNIGVACHITAAAPAGPRYDPSLTDDGRRSDDNGIWLCQNDAKLIDSDTTYFTVERLRGWKRLAENRSFRAIVNAASSRQFVATVSETLSDAAEKTVRHPAEHDIESLTSRVLIAAKNDLEAFKRVPGWPNHPITLRLRMVHDGTVQSVNAEALAAVVDTFNSITLIADPGFGKTTTLLQIVEAVLARGNSASAFIPLGEWSSFNDTPILRSILDHQAFGETTEKELKLLARYGRLVLVMDGWNELGQEPRQRAWIEIRKLQREFPNLGIILSTRGQALDTPISAPVVQIDTLTAGQQLEIARSMRGSHGVAILDEARRTAGVRELITIPLYLAALIANSKTDRLPATKEGVLRLFVTAHERKAERAEILRNAMFGTHTEVLTALAVEATDSETTSLSEARARFVTKGTGDRLVSEGQLRDICGPMLVLDLLVSHHLLVRSGTDAAAISFQHQQFQEWYASLHVEMLMRRAAEGDLDSSSKLRLGPLNVRAWEESVLFASERASRTDDTGARAVAGAVLDALGIDPMLAAEMIFRSSEAAWDRVRQKVVDFVGQWHRAGRVDRAVRFMIKSGKPDFAAHIWTLITDENDQVWLNAFRANERFRASVLGTDVAARIAELPEAQRKNITSQIAQKGDFDGMELAARIAAGDTSAQVKTSVIEALDFRGADRTITEVLRTAPDEVWTMLARKPYVEVTEPDAAARLKQERRHLIDTETDPLRKLRALLEAGRHGTAVGNEIAALIASEDFPFKDQHIGWSVNEAYKAFPEDVTCALRYRLNAGLEIPLGTEDVLRTVDVETDDGPIVDFVLQDRKPHSFIAAAMLILGPKTLGKLIDKLVAMKVSLNAPNHRADTKLAEQYRELVALIARARPSSFVKAILQRSAANLPEEIEVFGHLIGRHGKAAEPAEQVEAISYVDLVIAVERWADVLLASPSSNRGRLAELAMAIGRLRTPKLVGVLGRMLKEELEGWRRALEEKQASQGRARPSDAQMRLLDTTGYKLLYKATFAAIGGSKVIDVMKIYLCDIGHVGFGVEAAQVLKEVWDRDHSSAAEQRTFVGTEFSRVKSRRMERQKRGGGMDSQLADAIFTVIDDLIKPGSSAEQHRHAQQLALVAFSMAYSDREKTRDALLQLSQSLNEKQALLKTLVVGGEVVSADVIVAGVKAFLEEAKNKKWFVWDQNALWQVEGWLELLPFSDRPMATLEALELLEAIDWRNWGHRRLLLSLAYTPSSQAEDVLKALARRHPHLLANHDWIGALERHGSVLAARVLLEFISEGAYSTLSGADVWWLSRKLAAAMRQDVDFRADVYREYRGVQRLTETVLLEAAIAEAADEQGVLLIVRKHGEDGTMFSGTLQRALEHAAVGERPSETWIGSNERFGVSAMQLRKELFSMTGPDSARATLAKECLTAIDELRDEYGPVESEPRHPDIRSGRPWPTVGERHDYKLAFRPAVCSDKSEG